MQQAAKAMTPIKFVLKNALQDNKIKLSSNTWREFTLLNLSDLRLQWRL